jgi:hypothetical protein
MFGRNLGFGPNDRPFRFGHQQMGEARQPGGHHVSGNPIVPISKTRLRRWRDRMDALDTLRVTIENLPVSRREKDEIRRCTEQMRRIIDDVRAETRVKVEQHHLRAWQF